MGQEEKEDNVVIREPDVLQMVPAQGPPRKGIVKLILGPVSGKPELLSSWRLHQESKSSVVDFSEPLSGFKD
jgi:hypothetical protein